MAQPPADYVLVDLRGRLPTLPALKTLLQGMAPFWSALGQSDMLRERCYATVLIGNRQRDGVLVPVAWEFARYLAGLLTLKDEKIGCLPPAEPLTGQQHTLHFETDGQVYYALNFRREASHSPGTGRQWPVAGSQEARTTDHGSPATDRAALVLVVCAPAAAAGAGRALASRQVSRNARSGVRRAVHAAGASWCLIR